MSSAVKLFRKIFLHGKTMCAGIGDVAFES
jgi:hypothetical protein